MGFAGSGRVSFLPLLTATRRFRERQRLRACVSELDDDCIGARRIRSTELVEEGVLRDNGRPRVPVDDDVDGGRVVGEQAVERHGRPGSDPVWVVLSDGGHAA